MMTAGVTALQSHVLSYLCLAEPAFLLAFGGVQMTFPSHHLALHCTKQAETEAQCDFTNDIFLRCKLPAFARPKLWERILQRPPLPLRLLYLFSCSASMPRFAATFDLTFATCHARSWPSSVRTGT